MLSKAKFILETKLEIFANQFIPSLTRGHVLKIDILSSVLGKNVYSSWKHQRTHSAAEKFNRRTYLPFPTQIPKQQSFVFSLTLFTLSFLLTYSEDD